MLEYSKVNVKSTGTKLKKLKTAIENKTGTTLRMDLKMLDGNDLPHELLLTKKQKTKLRNAFNNKISTYIKLSKAKISKIIQSGELLGLILSKLAVRLAKNILTPLAIKAAASAIDAEIQKKIHSSKTTFNNFK